MFKEVGKGWKVNELLQAKRSERGWGLLLNFFQGFKAISINSRSEETDLNHILAYSHRFF